MSKIDYNNRASIEEALFRGDYYEAWKRGVLVYSLANLRDVAARPALERVLAEDPNDKVRIEAMRGLKKLLGQDARSVLERALTHDVSETVREEAANMLRRVS